MPNKYTLSEAWKKVSALGGKARAEALTASRRRQIAAMGGRASAGKPKTKKP